MNEQCWILKGWSNRWFWKARYDQYSVGRPASVEFDHEYVWRNRREIVGAVHSHPSWTATPSGTDDATMGAMVNCLGKPFLCCIIGTDGLRAWWYKSDTEPPSEVRAFRFGDTLFGRMP